MIFLTFSNNSFAQNVDCNFRTYKKFSKVKYASNVPLMNFRDGSFIVKKSGLPKVTVNTFMDIYVPNLKSGEATTTNFPIVFICHGANTSRTNNPALVNSIATELAIRGFVTCVIDYRHDWEVILENLTLFPALNVLTNYSTPEATCDKSDARKYTDRVFYSQAMDVQNAISYMVTYKNLYRANIDKIVVGGHSLGGATALFNTYVDKDEIDDIFPSTFYSDNRYIDLNLHRSKLKNIFSFSGTLSNLDYIDIDETTPVFMVHGTHDAASPFYTGSQFCSKLAVGPDWHGSAAISERIDSFPDNLNFSYYFVQLNGIAHSPFVEAGNMNSPFCVNLWKADYLKYMLNCLFPIGGTYPKNQIHKIVTPINPVYNYCNENISGVDYYYSNAVATQPGDTTPCGVPFYSCLTIPQLNLTTKSWVDNYSTFCTNGFPQISFNTYTTDTCYIFINDSLRFRDNLPPLSDDYLYLNGNYSFMRKAKDESNLEELGNKLEIFPNPASTVITIEVSTKEVIKDIIIISMNGEVITNKMNKNNNKADIDVSTISSGNYIINITTDKGFYSKKISKY